MEKVAVFGIYSTRRRLENGLEELKASGFHNPDISVLLADPLLDDVLLVNDEKARARGYPALEASAEFVSASSMGGALAELAGIGAVAMPGAGPLIAAGPILVALTSALTSARAGEGIIGALMRAGIPESDAKGYEIRIRGGCILISVHVADSNCRDRAHRILEETGAEDIGFNRESSEIFPGPARFRIGNRAGGSL